MEAEIVYEPLNPSQDQLKVTAALTGVYVDIDSCSVCGQVRGIGFHHVIFRSHGGTDGPVLPLCLKCHNSIHEGEWEARLIAQGPGQGAIELLGPPDDTVIWRLQAWPGKDDAGRFIRSIDAAHDAQQRVMEVAGALLPWQKREVFDALRSVQEGGWRAQVRLLDEYVRYGTPGLSPGEKEEAAMALFDIRRATYHNYRKIGETFRESDALERTEVSQRIALTAASTTEPEKWIDVAQERKLQDRNFTSDDLKEEAIIAGAWKPDAEGNVPEPKSRTQYGKCKECGHVGYFEVLPVGSDGKPVEPGE